MVLVVSVVQFNEYVMFVDVFGSLRAKKKFEDVTVKLYAPVDENTHTSSLTDWLSESDPRIPISRSSTPLICTASSLMMVIIDVPSELSPRLPSVDDHTLVLKRVSISRTEAER